MEEEQILKIKPDLGRQTAVIRAPGACHRTQVVQKRKNRFQPNLNTPGPTNRPVQFRTMKPNKVIEIPINGFPCVRVSPKGFSSAEVFPHEFIHCKNVQKPKF
jgi:hypothetical protein